MDIITKQSYAAMTDLACVKTETTIDEIKEMAEAAVKWGFIGVYALPAHNPMLFDMLKGNSRTFVGGAVGFPSGSTATETKVFETREEIKAGCGEIDMVVNISWLKAGLFDNYRRDITEVIKAAEGKIVKAIIEVHYLSDDEISAAAKIAAECGISFIKTATGWAESGATVNNIGIIKEAIAGTGCQIKAAGGIRDLATVKQMIDQGVTRFGCGTATALKILDEIE